MNLKDERRELRISWVEWLILSLNKWIRSRRKKMKRSGSSKWKKKCKIDSMTKWSTRDIKMNRNE